MTTPADIVNRAIQFIGGFNDQGPVSGSPPTFDGTTYGLAAGQLYTSTVQTVGRQFGWDFARNVATLVETDNDPQYGFAFEYIYPTSGIQLGQVFAPVDVVNDDLNDPRPTRWVVGSAYGPATSASGYLTFPALPTNLDTITLNGAVFTFVTSGATPTNFQFNITGNLAGQLLICASVLNAYTTPGLAVATYSASGSRLIITYDAPGPDGNDYTLAASVATPSGPHLTGGANALQKVIWTNVEDALATITGQPPENAWDALFTEAVVRELASGLAAAIPSKLESAKMLLETSVGFGDIGEKRTDT